jgi:hypothetical protein
MENVETGTHRYIILFNKATEWNEKITFPWVVSTYG